VRKAAPGDDDAPKDFIKKNNWKKPAVMEVENARNCTWLSVREMKSEKQHKKRSRGTKQIVEFTVEGGNITSAFRRGAS
jgi:hypothetical protein